MTALTDLSPKEKAATAKLVAAFMNDDMEMCSAITRDMDIDGMLRLAMAFEVMEVTLRVIRKKRMAALITSAGEAHADEPLDDHSELY